MVGQVGQPSPVAYRDGMTVLDAILQVGGLSPFAAGNKARIVRTEDGRQRVIKVRLDDLVKKGELEHNVPVLPGDVIVVPESMF